MKDLLRVRSNIPSAIPARSVAAALLVVVVVGQAHAWNTPGHMAIAAFAYDELTASERTKVVRILRRHPDLSPIAEGFPGRQIGDRELFLAAAAWPDLIRLRQGYVNKGKHETPPLDRIFSDGQVHPGWHFRDSPLWIAPSPEQGTIAPDGVDAVSAVGVLMRQLKSNEDVSARAYDLAWLFHLVGDLHQPLHSVAGFTTTLPKGDDGGNAILVVKTGGKTGSLHSFWDGALGSTHDDGLADDVAKAGDVARRLHRTSLARIAQPDSIAPETWAQESRALAERWVYRPLAFEPGTVVKDGKTRNVLFTRIDARYANRACREARTRARLAGHRLALILRSILR